MRQKIFKLRSKHTPRVNSEVSLKENPASLSYPGKNQQWDMMEITSHNLTEPVVFRQVGTLPEVSHHSGSFLGSNVLIRMNTKEPRRVTGPRV